MRDASDELGGLAKAGERDLASTSKYTQATLEGFSASSGEEAVAAARSAAGAMAGWMGASKALGWLGWWVTYTQINAWIASKLDKVPILGNFGLGRAYLFLSKGPGDYLFQWAGNALGGEFDHFAHHWVQSVGWAGAQHHWVTQAQLNQLLYTSAPAPSLPGGPSASEITKINARLNYEQQEIDSLNYQLAHPSGGTATAPQVWTEIHAAQRSLAALNRAMTNVQDRVEAVEDVQAEIQTTLSRLASQLHGISAIAVTWQELSDEVDHLTNTVTQLSNSTTQQLTHQERQITQLAPLGLLLEPGISGLKTLRSLEDKPCQCPEFAGVPNWLGTAIGIMEFVENG